MKKTTTITVKNMVCNRCIRVVKEDLESLGLVIDTIELGKISIEGEIPEEKILLLKRTLLESGFELIEDRQSQLIEAVKTLVIEHIHHKKEKPEYLNFSDYLAQKANISYSNLSRLFSSVEGITIEKYIILQKIERVKELLVYGEYSLSEIAFELDYSSVAHLSGQFKKVTGLSPSEFRKLTGPRRRALDEINKKL